MALARGSSIGPYQILFRLGSGGMGEVWRARDTRSDRDVAIKVLSPEAVRDPERMSRFATESKAATALKHPNILAVYEVGESEFGPYIVMEFVDGETVRSMLNEGRLPLGRALDVAAQAAEGIANAHAAGMVHRDVKPENLMVSRQGVVKILDFGLARLLRPGGAFGDTEAARTAVGMVVGTAGYLSPEQLRGERATERSDVFALGVVLYEMAMGSNPFQRSNAVETFSAILRDDPPPLDRVGAPAELSFVIGRALAKKPEERFASAQELAADLWRVRALVGGESETEHAPEVSPAGPRRGALLIATVAIFAVAVVGLLALRGC